ncbi:hypothetical protein ABPG72_000233 [Tetrahymena utriculariae]
MFSKQFNCKLPKNYNNHIRYLNRPILSLNCKLKRIQNFQNPSDLSINFDDLFYVEVSSNGNTLYLSSYKSGLITFNIQDKANPIMKNKYISSQTSNMGGSTISLTQFTATKLSSQQDQIIASNSLYGAVIFKQSNSDLKILEQYKVFQNKYGCTVQCCDFSSDGQNQACPCKEIGTLLFDLKDQSLSIQLKYIIYQIGVEQAKISDDNKLLFLANGCQGLLIFDITNFLNPVQLSEILLEGWTYKVYPIFKNQYIIAIQVDEGQIALINIQDPKNLNIQQKKIFLEKHQLMFVSTQKIQSICILQEIWDQDIFLSRAI